jgi:DNA-binding NtrC family response regulator
MERPQRILVIEDDPILRDLMADWLIAAGYLVDLAPEGASGIASVKAEPPALVVTDMYMPGTCGAAVIAEVARIHPGLPVIAISAHFLSHHGITPDEAKALGAAFTLAKPFKRKDMVGAVMELVGPPGG